MVSGGPTTIAASLIENEQRTVQYVGANLQ
jgi:hypothetical protein